MKLCAVQFHWLDHRKHSKGTFGGAVGSAWGALASIAGYYEDGNRTENADLICDLEGGWLPASIVPGGIPKNNSMNPMLYEVCPVRLDGELIAYLIRVAR